MSCSQLVRTADFTEFRKFRQAFQEIGKVFALQRKYLPIALRTSTNYLCTRSRKKPHQPCNLPNPPPKTPLQSTKMDFSSLETIWIRAQEALEYVEEHIIRLPRANSIRLLVIIGVYCLIRPYLLNWGGIKQKAEDEKALDEDEDEDSSAANEAQNASNTPSETLKSSSNDKGATWGEKARARQKRPIRELVEGSDEPSGADAGSDQEIEEFLRTTIR